ncbi:hypothetical protein PF005_g20417 [Phytophthora fragariae]|uniref:Secreted protein n=1 Tax=Phytophthora fragariae TaxID=53985 RepID=A0A6A3EE14_9STRA|nr:hypothetical protein PF003_g13955 [Phytophthora fragariae]KAE8928398.1 hypothetical protein PF009_g21460 [Phytophthora fragariae]KAE8961030.1 hypothetical protein PF011_g29897 [Phytophthora fragariae]KAE9087119.1 hypothetical protein PF007_g20502 [Phytophthora fragariae]KAE9087765.1 hypothetical protein PF010_g19611 [Phytophthora fragariae]
MHQSLCYPIVCCLSTTLMCMTCCDVIIRCTHEIPSHTDNRSTMLFTVEFKCPKAVLFHATTAANNL